MIDKVNRFFAWVVSINYYIYLVVGLVIGLALYFLGWQTSFNDHLNFLKTIGIPIVLYSLILRLFCMIFYQEKYDDFSFRKINHNMHIGITRTDGVFYSVITEKNLNRIRKFSGYTYATSKPLVFMVYGMIIVSLLIVISGRT